MVEVVASTVKGLMLDTPRWCSVYGLALLNNCMCLSVSGPRLNEEDVIGHNAALFSVNFGTEKRLCFRRYVVCSCVLF